MATATDVRVCVPVGCDLTSGNFVIAMQDRLAGRVFPDQALRESSLALISSRRVPTARPIPRFLSSPVTPVGASLFEQIDEPALPRRHIALETLAELGENGNVSRSRSDNRACHTGGDDSETASCARPWDTARVAEPCCPISSTGNGPQPQLPGGVPPSWSLRSLPRRCVIRHRILPRCLPAGGTRRRNAGGAGGCRCM